MTKKIMLVLSILVLGVLNYGIYQKEQIKKTGQTLLLELAPVDPRSLLQGDYMQLRYTIAVNIPATAETPPMTRGGYIVIREDTNNVGQFVRFYKQETLASDEKILRFYRSGNNNIIIIPDSFFFQEGHVKYYQHAKYGIFKFDSASNFLLVGLANADKKQIIVTQGSTN
jgi:uncharacterized membrane-anchored protein